MSRCYLCGTLLNESNRSVEHIIPNAIGGHLKSKNLLCKDCNSNTGQKIDVNDTLRMYKNDDIRMYNFDCITDTIVEVITTCNTYTLLTVHLL